MTLSDTVNVVLRTIFRLATDSKDGWTMFVLRPHPAAAALTPSTIVGGDARQFEAKHAEEFVWPACSRQIDDGTQTCGIREHCRSSSN